MALAQTPSSVTRRDRRRVAGLATRTTNADEAAPSTARIPGLWSQFIAHEGGAFGPTLAVYSAYESDVSGSYEILIGREVAGSSQVAPALHVVDISAGQYLVFGCSGSLPGAVIEGWRAIWAFFEQPDAPRRAYTTDFEAYLEPERVEIWIAVSSRA